MNGTAIKLCFHKERRGSLVTVQVLVPLPGCHPCLGANVGSGPASDQELGLTGTVLRTSENPPDLEPKSHRAQSRCSLSHSSFCLNHQWGINPLSPKQRFPLSQESKHQQLRCHCGVDVGCSVPLPQLLPKALWDPEPGSLPDPGHQGTADIPKDWDKIPLTGR